jgi:acyl-CoA dehydrogenase
MAHKTVPTLLDFENQPSPFYTEGHKKYRLHVRKFVNEHLAPYVEEWEKRGSIPRDFFPKIAQYGGLWLFPWGLGRATEWEGYKWDPFYAIIFAEEWAQANSFSGAVHIHNMSSPALIYFGKNEVHRKAVAELARGEKLISIAISEMSAGSDVASVSATMELSDDGKDYIVNGSKYWITGGERADYFVVLAREKPSGKLTVILVPRIKGQVYTSKIDVQGNPCNDTASVTFVNARVPKENIVGKIGDGFKIIMFGFNNERFIIAASAIASAIVCVNDAIAWARERKTFGKPLIKHQVIRHKIAEMSRQVFASKSMLEHVAYQMKFDRLGIKDRSVPRNIALLKVQASRTLQFVTIECSQIFGGRSFVRGGRAAIAERVYRTARSIAIAGGSEEIMYDLAMRQAKL